ncbi:MAG: transposase, partial [Butyrivibrio sp.]|nr:transposase [Butyrivibrio sp.]
YISYDSSNKNCQAGDIDLIEYGKAKDDKGLAIFNLAIAFDKTNRVPLFYEDYPGSITDVSQFVHTVDKVTEYGYKNAGFILDRGYFSKDNIRYMESEGYAFVIMVKGCKELVSSLVLKHRNTFETSREYSIRSYRVYGKTIKSKLYEDDSKTRFFHIYFNPSRQAAEREQLEAKLDKFKLYMDKHLGEEVTLSKTYHHYFKLTFDKKGCLLSYKEQYDVIQKELQLCGYFCIITSEDMNSSQALIHYKGRDISEKLFSADKSFIGSKSMRICTNEAMETKLFIEFIALIIRNRIYNLLKETMLSLEQRPNYMTVPAAIRELEKIELIRRNGGSYRLDHAVSKRQKIILSSFGMNSDDISAVSIEIDKLLRNNQSLMDTEGDTDEEVI